MALYNRLAAVNYALKWAVGGGNPIWPDYHQTSGGGGDCTNFISQCLYAGGWEMRYGGQNIFAWYCWPKRRWDHSKSWTSADYFGFLLKNSGRAHPCSLADLSFGDLVKMVGEDQHLDHLTGGVAVTVCDGLVRCGLKLVWVGG
jgi:Putative amidase domain